MSGHEPVRPSAPRVVLTVLAAVSATMAAVVGCPSAGRSMAFSPSWAAARLDASRGELHRADGRREGDQRRRAPTQAGRSRRNARGRAGGAVPGAVTAFDSGIPAVANLDSALQAALRRAATDAADDGVEIRINGGWRSPEYQARLFRAAVWKYGSDARAARWVATPDTSPHVSGAAVDIGPASAAAWLSGHGAAYGLCQIYRNEPWHYELRRDAIVAGCPAMYADPTHDPRMQP